MGREEPVCGGRMFGANSGGKAVRPLQYSVLFGKALLSLIGCPNEFAGRTSSPSLTPRRSLRCGSNSVGVKIPSRLSGAAQIALVGLTDLHGFQRHRLPTTRPVREVVHLTKCLWEGIHFLLISMRILLIGGNGFIGSPLMSELRRLGHTVAVFHRSADGAATTSKVVRIQGDRNRLS